ncbi:hypothetical protein IFM89_011859 [Coptis chinensis]|uniref:Uncharacterized protein n=1 Tax=Coptis chinensis TaxID=261450 RepID=A0A835I009_9MAGN|nr:hypothetical protein IFM89_011859 [Coptis chinensis]
MELEFRVRDYEAEEAAHSLPRIPTHNNHPLLFIIPPSSTNYHNQVDSGSFYDPLRGGPTVSLQDYNTVYVEDTPSDEQWLSFKRSIMQTLSSSKTVSISPISDVIIKSGKAYEKSSTSLHLEELDNPQKDGLKVITRQEYVSRLRELKDEIGKAWKDDDRVTSLKLSIKVARLLMDTSVSEFYPPLFILVIDVMDMLGDMVWERIKRKAEYTDDGTLISSLPDDFGAKDVCSDAKETCYNWFCKIGSIPELLPRIKSSSVRISFLPPLACSVSRNFSVPRPEIRTPMMGEYSSPSSDARFSARVSVFSVSPSGGASYLELAILRCWRFVHEQPCGIFHRLVMMIRGLADPLASFYCRLYMVRCAQKMLPHDTGYLFTCVGDIKIILTSIILEKETTHKKFWENKKSLISMLEPTIEWIMKCMCKDLDKTLFEEMLVELQLGRELSNSSGAFQYISVILHYFLKGLPAEIVCSHASYIVQLIESTNDISLEQYLNFRLLGLKLFDGNPHMDYVRTVLAKVFQGVSQYNSLNEYLEVVDAFLDIVLKYNMFRWGGADDDVVTTSICGIREVPAMMAGEVINTSKKGYGVKKQGGQVLDARTDVGQMSTDGRGRSLTGGGRTENQVDEEEGCCENEWILVNMQVRFVNDDLCWENVKDKFLFCKSLALKEKGRGSDLEKNVVFSEDGVWVSMTWRRYSIEVLNLGSREEMAAERASSEGHGGQDRVNQNTVANGIGESTPVVARELGDMVAERESDGGRSVDEEEELVVKTESGCREEEQDGCDLRLEGTGVADHMKCLNLNLNCVEGTFVTEEWGLLHEGNEYLETCDQQRSLSQEFRHGLVNGIVGPGQSFVPHRVGSNLTVTSSLSSGEHYCLDGLNPAAQFTPQDVNTRGLLCLDPITEFILDKLDRLLQISASQRKRKSKQYERVYQRKKIYKALRSKTRG